jgi:hypothetical protein
VKQHLAAIRMICDWRVVGQVIATNPAAPVRGPRHVVRKGKTPVLAPRKPARCSIPFPVTRLSGCAIGR